ncbi:unnamed protein product [Oppiella nova]|uniref:Uncharacterized protein n=1 Tax=Oppiella nova TaxID=334625 RepID=A0A7R9MAD2_9ACAR|nr:unnamed protein product [Oppiella nova]CAG2173646.1 unnamed protein product [Oppiella nova]
MATKYNFEGKVTLITGSSSGIGAAIALLFARSGARVVVSGLDGRDVHSVADECATISSAESVLGVVSDVRLESDCRRLIATTIDSFGRLDILVNSTGVFDMTGITDPGYMQKQSQVFDVNLNSVILLTHLSVKYLEITKGNIIYISSIGGERAVIINIVTKAKNISSYCMTKCALNMFTKCMATELGTKGIRINAISPGIVQTNIFKTSGYSDEQAKLFWEADANRAARYPVGHYGEPIDVAQCALYLASSNANFITGTIHVVDGGASLGYV